MTTDLLYQDLTYTLQGVFFKVYNSLGFGHKENIYHKALHIELQTSNIPFEEEISIPVFYENQKVGTYRPDFVIDGKILIEIKALLFLPKEAETQLLYYLKGTKYPLGFLINFGSPKLEIKRKIWTVHYQ